MTSEPAPGLSLEERTEPHGRTRFALAEQVSGRPVDVSSLTIDVIELSDGAGGIVRCGGIGNVETRPSHRRRGLAARLLDDAVEWMVARALDGSLLYGIDDYYDRFGWRSCGDERWVRVSLADMARLPAGPTDVKVRGYVATDHPAMVELYAELARTMPGAALRSSDGRAWARLEPSEVRVAYRDGQLVGWTWRGLDGPPEHTSVAARERHAVVFSELQAVNDDVALALLHDACAWAVEQREEPGREQLLVGAPEGHPLRALARAGRIPARLVDELRPTGGPMLRPFTDAARALGTDLYQFLPDRF
ncbi:MAG: GCN5-related N-acetyltransferase [Thermoleophilia bacterium]|nr:GCN5-related N-acetyltransferase [Thermoleophilia bacterium]